MFYEFLHDPDRILQDLIQDLLQDPIGSCKGILTEFWRIFTVMFKVAFELLQKLGIPCKILEKKSRENLGIEKARRMCKKILGMLGKVYSMESSENFPRIPSKARKKIMIQACSIT